MNTDTGEIRQLENSEKSLPTEVLLSNMEAAYLQLLAEKDRPKEYKELHSHNNNKRRRSLRRMQNASKVRNRK